MSEIRRLMWYFFEFKTRGLIYADFLLLKDVMLLLGSHLSWEYLLNNAYSFYAGVYRALKIGLAMGVSVQNGATWYIVGLIFKNFWARNFYLRVSCHLFLCHSDLIFNSNLRFCTLILTSLFPFLILLIKDIRDNETQLTRVMNVLGTVVCLCAFWLLIFVHYLFKIYCIY